MSKKARSSVAHKRRAPVESGGTNTRWLVAGGIGLVLVVAAVVAVFLSSAEPALAEPAAEPVVVTGAPLPEFVSGQPDPALGATIPTVTGTDLDRAPMTISADGRAKAIIVLAHTCPHCQAEVPVIVDWMAGNPIPDGVDVVALSTLINPAGSNYPPSGWLEREGWDVPTLNDDAAATAYQALSAGLGTPAFVFVTADGAVYLRTSGELEPQVFGEILDQIAP
jgi:hypothetical protein